MASYNTVRTAEAQPIGSVVPWVGKLTEIPPGWLVCNGQELDAADYPLLARILQTTYGGANLSGDFPNYTGTFKLPNVNQKGLADICTEYFTNNQTTPGADQPTLNIDTGEALTIIAPYIGSEGDINAPSTTFGITDLDMTYTPDPDGIIERITFSGVASDTNIPILYESVTGVVAAPSEGLGAVFNVIRNPSPGPGQDPFYTVAIRAKGSGYEVGDVITIDYSVIGGASSANNLTITVDAVGNGFFSGTITGRGGEDLEFTPGFGIQSVTVVPRKLGRDHMPSHIHTGQYSTISKTDVTETPGRGVGVWDNPEIEIVESWYGLNPVTNQLTGARTYEGNNQVNIGNVWGDSATGTITTVICPFIAGVGRYALASIAGTPPAKTHTPIRTAFDAHGVGRNWFENAKKLRDANGNVSPGNAKLNQLILNGKFDEDSTVPFSDDTFTVQVMNYDDATNGSDSVDSRKEVFYNNAAISFTKLTRTNLSYNDIIIGHNHQGEFNVTFDNGSLSIPSRIQAQVAPNVVPDSVPNAFQVTFQTRSPSLSIINLIRAY